jgi:hypothetical protein
MTNNFPVNFEAQLQNTYVILNVFIGWIFDHMSIFSNYLKNSGEEESKQIIKLV